MFFDNANGIQVVDLEELSNAIAKRDFRLTVVELWPFPFRNATPSVTSLIAVSFINVIKQFQLQH